MYGNSPKPVSTLLLLAQWYWTWTFVQMHSWTQYCLLLVATEHYHEAVKFYTNALQISPTDETMGQKLKDAVSIEPFQFILTVDVLDSANILECFTSHVFIHFRVGTSPLKSIRRTCLWTIADSVAVNGGVGWVVVPCDSMRKNNWCRIIDIDRKLHAPSIILMPVAFKVVVCK